MYSASCLNPNPSLVPRLSKSARGGEEEESLVSAVYAYANFTQILGASFVSTLVM